MTVKELIRKLEEYERGFGRCEVRFHDIGADGFFELFRVYHTNIVDENENLVQVVVLE